MSKDLRSTKWSSVSEKSVTPCANSVEHVMEQIGSIWKQSSTERKQNRTINHDYTRRLGHLNRRLNKMGQTVNLSIKDTENMLEIDHIKNGGIVAPEVNR